MCFSKKFSFNSAQNSVSNAQIECKQQISVDNSDGLCLFFVEQPYGWFITTGLISTLPAICLHISNRFPFVTNSLSQSPFLSLCVSLLLQSNSMIIVIARAFCSFQSFNKQEQFSRFCKTIAYKADVDFGIDFCVSQ